MHCIHAVKGLSGDQPTCMLPEGTMEVWGRMNQLKFYLSRHAWALWAGHEDSRGHMIVEQQAGMRIISWVHPIKGLPSQMFPAGTTVVWEERPAKAILGQAPM